MTKQGHQRYNTYCNRALAPHKVLVHLDSPELPNVFTNLLSVMFAKNSVLTIQSLSYLLQYTTSYFHLVENEKSDILVNFFSWIYFIYPALVLRPFILSAVFSAPFQFTPILNFRSHIFGLIHFG